MISAIFWYTWGSGPHDIKIINLNTDDTVNLTLDDGTLNIDCSAADASVMVVCSNYNVPITWGNADASSTLTISSGLGYNQDVNFQGTLDIDGYGGWYAPVTANIITGSFAGDDTYPLNASTSISNLSIGGNVFAPIGSGGSISNLTINGDLCDAMTASSDITNLNITGDMLGTITSTGGSIYLTAGNILSKVSAHTGLTVYANQQQWDGINGILTSDGGYLNAYANGSILGTLGVGNNGTLTAQSYYGQITGNFSSGGDIYSLTAAKSISVNMTANGNIDAITAGQSYGTPVMGVTLSGIISSNQTIGTLTATAGINATATAYGSILSINAGTGNLAGSFTTQHGSLQQVNATYGNITATLTGASVGTVTALQNISGNILATGSIDSITTVLGNLTGTVTSMGGGIGNVFVAGTMSGSVFANTGSIGAMMVLDNITSGSTIAAGSGDLDIQCLGDVAGTISASTNIWLSAAGTVSGNVTTTYGNVVIRAGGDITSPTVSAGVDIFLRAGGDTPAIVSMLPTTLA